MRQAAGCGFARVAGVATLKVSSPLKTCGRDHSQDDYPDNKDACLKAAKPHAQPRREAAPNRSRVHLPRPVGVVKRGARSALRGRRRGKDDYARPISLSTCLAQPTSSALGHSLSRVRSRSKARLKSSPFMTRSNPQVTPSN
jgi:hypothetical protein